VSVFFAEEGFLSTDSVAYVLEIGSFSFLQYYANFLNLVTQLLQQ